MKTVFAAAPHDPGLYGTLAEYFDFRPPEAAREMWCMLEGREPPLVFGLDTAGGEFAIAAPGRVLYASPEGQAGIIAANAMEFFSLIVELPYWRSLLKFSGGGSLAEMRRAAPVCEELALMREPGLDLFRDIARSEINLAIPADPVGRLHRAASSQHTAIQDRHGRRVPPLVGEGSADDLLRSRPIVYRPV